MDPSNDGGSVIAVIAGLYWTDHEREESSPMHTRHKHTCNTLQNGEIVKFYGKGKHAKEEGQVGLHCTVSS